MSVRIFVGKKKKESAKKFVTVKENLHFLPTFFSSDKVVYIYDGYLLLHIISILGHNDSIFK